MMYIAPTGFMISNTKDSSGNWEWTTFGTGAGFSANLINAGTLLADRVGGGTLSSLDGSLKINLDNGVFQLLAADTGWKGIDLINRSIDFYSFITQNKKVGTIQTVGNTQTGKDYLNVGITDGASGFTVTTSRGTPLGVYTSSGDDYVDIDKIQISKTRDGDVWSGTFTAGGIAFKFVDGLLTSATLAT
ncbi:hypothetical protein KYB31_09075 [Clostridium felsineum]|uniref:hypothetical protein n=1 Tax=Clostridium felsineum TaxID=36839 RepID=UPI00214D5924|nr:hypothetical protein [Clostridium felsineum]MCR3759140.1 hypothetical protein [Clostridium felsineum]